MGVLHKVTQVRQPQDAMFFAAGSTADGESSRLDLNPSYFYQGGFRLTYNLDHAN